MTITALDGTASPHFVTEEIACVLGINGKVLAAGGYRGGLCEERLGLTCARHSLFQLAPTNPSQDTAGPITQDSGTLGKHISEKATKAREGRD